jgi:hypothetical protein
VTDIYAEAMLRLVPTEQGGLDRPVVTGTRGLLLKFDTDDGEVQLGAVVELRGRTQLLPGEEAPVELHFWADEARIYATPGSRFRAWHGRDVGEGTISRLHDHELA